MQKNLNTVIIILSLIIPQGASGKCGSATPWYSDKSIIVVGLTNPPTTIDPVKLWSSQHFMMAQATNQSLVRVNESGQIVSAIADRWESYDNGRRYRFHLNSRAKFHNNVKITSHDVAVSFARHLWPKTDSIVGERLSTILVGGHDVKTGIPRGIKEVDESTIDFELIGPYPPFLRLVAVPAFSIYPFNINNKDGSQSSWISSGPMIATKYDSENRTWYLRRFEGYELSEPKTDGLVIRLIRNTDDAIDQIASGTLDIFIGASSEALAKRQLPPNVKITKSQTLAVMHFFFNNENIMFKNKALRHDIALAINQLAKDYKNAFLKYEPYFIPSGVMPPYYYQRNIPDISDSEIRHKWANKLSGRSIKVVLKAEYFDSDFSKIIAQKLALFGLSPKVIRIPVSDFKKAVDTSDYDLISGGYTASYPDPDDLIDSINNKPNTYHYGNIPSSVLVNSLERNQFNGNKSQRLDIYAHLLKDFEEQWYFIPLFRVYLTFIHKADIVIPSSNYKYEPELWNVTCSENENKI